MSTLRSAATAARPAPGARAPGLYECGFRDWVVIVTASAGTDPIIIPSAGVALDSLPIGSVPTAIPITDPVPSQLPWIKVAFDDDPGTAPEQVPGQSGFAEHFVHNSWYGDNGWVPSHIKVRWVQPFGRIVILPQIHDENTKYYHCFRIWSRLPTAEEVL
jgi:hypothetical protein